MFHSRGLTQSEICKYLQDLSEDENVDDDELENLQVAIIPPEVDELTDEDDLNDNDTEGIVNEFAGTYEAHAMSEKEDTVSRQQPEKQSKNFNICAPKWKKVNPVYSETMTESAEIDRTAFENLGSHSVEEIFELLLSQDLIQDIIAYSIEYAKQKNNHEFNLTSNELKIFIGILLFTGYHRQPQEEMYWELLPDAGVPIVYNSMTRERYREIKKYLHLCDNSNLDKKDKFAKLRPYLDGLKKNYIQFGVFSSCLSLDEMMIKYYGMHSAKMFMRGKPIKFGYKFWCLCSANGYIYNFDPYYGKGSDDSKYPLGMRVVKKLTEVLPANNQPYELFFDNFFTSVETLSLLQEKSLKATGTIRENRCKKCPLIDSKAMKKKDRGFIDYRFDCANKILITRWNDNKPVSVATNYSSVYPTATAKRFSQKEKKFLTVDMPKCISEYNRSMGGVDMLDKQVSLYRTRIRGKKWWFSVFTQFLDVTVVNAWRLYQEASGDKKMPLLNARRKIVLSYLSKPCSSNRKRSGRKNSISEGRVSKAIRLDEGNHLVQPIATQRRCAKCGKKTKRICTRCQVPLHDKCFQEFHTK